MLELKKINKSYKTGSFIQHALKDINLKFRKKEFVAILGASGSGKTTLLNIIGGLDRYDNGDLIINDKSTKKFKDTEWDAYRNGCIGFVFQSYNLITHISVLDNVEMGMTLSGVSTRKKRKKALEVLEKVGLKDHAHKRPNQLSGGQMQRVAIARALANDPDIILADEPTGALDSNTSVQIMELIKEIANDKLVIMVTHNQELAHSYANRIVELKDGELLNDSNPVVDSMEDDEKFKIKKTAMNYLSALRLSFNNIVTKKGRTLITAFASSIGIIGIALILALSNGFDIQIDKFESETLSGFPIMITESTINMSKEQMEKIHKEQHRNDFPSEKVIYPKDNTMDTITHQNNLDEEYINYIEKINPSYVSGLSYERITALNLLIKNNNTVNSFISQNAMTIPKSLNKNTQSYLEKNYDLLSGSLPKKNTDLILIVSSNNELDKDLVDSLGLDSKLESISFDKIVGKELKLILNDEYYKNVQNYFIANNNLEDLYNNSKAITLKISGIIRIKEDIKMSVLNTGIAYSSELFDYIISINKDSEIVKKQLSVNYNVLNGKTFTEQDNMTKDQLLSYLGGSTVPYMINIYPVDFESKEQIVKYLDTYNENKDEDNKIIYTDLAETFSSLSGDIMNAVTIVLIAFSSVSLIVSSIMIGIITYISVLERTKEIGVLRSLGARKKDITRVFNAETFIIGFTSGMIGLLIARLLIIPANIIIKNLTNLKNVAQMNPTHALVLLLISISLTIIGGFIPAKIASRKDPVEALRSE